MFSKLWKTRFTNSGVSFQNLTKLFSSHTEFPSFSTMFSGMFWLVIVEIGLNFDLFPFYFEQWWPYSKRRNFWISYAYFILFFTLGWARTRWNLCEVPIAWRSRRSFRENKKWYVTDLLWLIWSATEKETFFISQHRLQNSTLIKSGSRVQLPSIWMTKKKKLTNL